MARRERPTLSAWEDGGVLHVGGDDRVYSRDSRTWWLKFRNARIAQTVGKDLYSTVEMDQSLSMVHELQIRGTAYFEAHEKITVAGWGDSTETLPAIIRSHRPPMDNREHGLKQWEAVVGFTPRDPEMGRRSTDTWYLEIVIPAEQVERMVAAMRAGEVAEFWIGILAGFYVIDGDHHTPIGYPVERFLVPEKKEFGEPWPASVRGEVLQVTWVQPDPEKPSELPEPAPEEVISPPVAEPDRLDPLIQRIDQLRATVVRVGWLLVAVVLIAAFV